MGMFIIVLVLIVAYFAMFFREITITIDSTIKRVGQINACKEWCESKGFLITFNKSEQATCKSKCYNMAILPPIMDLLCNTVCPSLDVFLNGKCIRNENCSYYSEVNELDVTEAVKTRWLKAITNKVKNQFI